MGVNLDAYLVCQSCNSTPYAVYRIPTQANPGVYVNRLWPASPDVPLPEHHFLINCPTCGRELTRSASRLGAEEA